MAPPRRGESVSVPCRVCGKTFLKVTVAEGSHPVSCASCGKTTTVRVKCKGEVCQVTTEPAKDSDAGQSPG